LCHIRLYTEGTHYRRQTQAGVSGENSVDLGTSFVKKNKF
jgi:hypothetical protein